MRILITGGCGFVGSTVARAWMAADAGHEVVCLDNFSRAGSARNAEPLRELGVQVIEGDIRQMADLAKVGRVDWVLDAAANPSVLAGIEGADSSRQLIDNNLYGTVNMLEFCREHGAGFILLSTSRVYALPGLSAIRVEPQGSAYSPSTSLPQPAGFTEKGISEDFSTTPPLSLYGVSKAASELLALEYFYTFGFPVWINRCGVLAGAGQFGKPDQGIFAFWLHSWQQNRRLRYIGFDGTGRQVRDMLHPRDLLPLLEMQMAAAIDDSRDRVLNVAGGRDSAMSLAELSEWCEKRWGAGEVESDSVPRRFDAPYIVLDAARAQEQWGWQPQTSREAILTEIAEFAETQPDWLQISGA